MPTFPIEPVATYRVQLSPEFAFAEVAGILDQLVDLGISHLYLSPVLEACPGSQHGYDWLPPGRIAPLLGGDDGYRLLRETARAAGIGIVLDIVPNHCGVGAPLHNPWWADVLRHGVESRYSRCFDLRPVTVDGAADVIALPYLGSEDDLDALTLDDDGNLHLYEWVLPTTPGSAAPGDDPRVVLNRQHYRLVPHDSNRLSYRCYLDISELAALRQEDPEVFAATHAWLAELVADDLVDGVRVDHLDGLCDPLGYLTSLRALVGPDRLIYVEKALSVPDDERLDPSLPVEGTTGYEQLQLIEAAFTAAPGVIELDEVYRTVTGVYGDGDQLSSLAHQLRESTMRSSFPTRMRWASTAVVQSVLEHTGVDHPLYLVEQALATFIALINVSRPDYPVDRALTAAAITRARAAQPNAEAGFDALDTVFDDPVRHEEAAFRVSELAAAVQAKAIEDIGFHRTARLVSTQELGCNPRVPAIARGEFHDRNRVRAARYPLGLTATSTHDTKRSMDVRSRISVIAQVPQRWNLLVNRILRECPPPHERTAYLLLQNVIGLWPAQGTPDDDVRRRLADYATKAMREAALVTSWSSRNEAAEQETLDWLDDLMSGRPAELIGEFVSVIVPAGRAESLSRTAVALLGPGVGDLYQGSQWWNHSLTDPDNRRPVDYSRSTDHPKYRLIRSALAMRRRRPASFGAGSGYDEVRTIGTAARHLIAFSRGPAAGAPPEVVVVGVRLSHTFYGDEIRENAIVELPAGRWRDTDTGDEFDGPVTAAALLGDRSVSILELAED
ncbi:MAG: malto-oligosyltrehalose synthase [Gordonia sp. (in: high G+C Gram-positive bacteria)]|uniref:malto-oligosyltrehalose synthase n=1 Tax=Gordonia sp. (in: high G+C Gram-positive bacteria) TaxID=84139 RepID=UPI0039E24279